MIAIIIVKVLKNCRERIHTYLDKNTIQVTTVTDEEQSEQQEGDKPLKVEVKDPRFDSSKIKEYQKETVNTYNWKPETFEQFIGQEEAKARAKTIMKKAKKNIKAHFILSAIQGHGKTTFVQLVAKHLGAKLISRVGKQIDEDEVVDIVNEINNSKEKYVIFFCDEIDTTDWKVIKILNPIIEEFRINEKSIKPFIFASATINKHILVKNNPDTLDRIPHHIQFSRYNAEEIGRILTQYKNHLYYQEEVSDEVIKTISKNCKFNPRTSLALLEDFIVEKDIEKVLKNNRIVKNGLTDIDVKILKILNKSKRPMGANAVALRAGLTQYQYVREYEPFLYEFGYINRIPSRVISEKGKKLLEELNHAK